MAETIDTPEQWASRINWGVTTVADCYGIPDCKHQEGDWCLFDLDEDDPPIAVFPFREDADRVCQILRAVGGWDHILSHKARSLGPSHGYQTSSG